MSSNADYARYLVRAAKDAVDAQVDTRGGCTTGEEDAKVATAAILRQLANHPRPTGAWLEELADEIEGGEDR